MCVNGISVVCGIFSRVVFVLCVVCAVCMECVWYVCCAWYMSNVSVVLTGAWCSCMCCV